MENLFGVDYAWGYKAGVPAELKAAGVKFVCRYLSTPGNTKNITREERFALSRAGLQIVTVFETTAGRALSSRAGGIADARSAQTQLTGLAAPVGAPVYFAVDFDATPEQQTAINAYLIGAASVLGKNRVGIYGGYYPVKRALDAGVCRYAWQTYAWSGGQWDPRAHLQQYRNGMRLAGMSVDYNRATRTNFGQWFATPTPPTPRPLPPVPPPPESRFPKDDTFWTWLRWYRGLGEFEIYGKRYEAVRPNVPRRIPAAWWRGLRYYLSQRPPQ